MRNWLKVQQNVAFVKKIFKRGAVPSRETVKTLIENKYQDNVARLNSSRSKRQRSCSAIENKLASYGVTFPAKKIDAPIPMSLLQPNAEHEEKEQLRMATKLSLVTQEPSEPSEPSEPCSLEPITDGITNKSTSDFTSDPDEAASILLSLSNNKR